MTIDFAKLRDPFPAEDIEWRVQQAGKNGERVWARVLAYVTNRAIQSRLDDVVGPGNWQNVFTTGPGGGVLCGISVKVDGEWVTKWDGAENTDIEAIKGGLSGAMKRAAVQWGIGRYLYNLEAGYGEIVEKGRPGAIYAKKTKELPAFYWLPPALPAWALPGGSGAPDAKPAGQTRQQKPTPAKPAPKAAAPPKEGKSPLRRLADLTNELDIPAERVTELAHERYGRGPRELRDHEIEALIGRLRSGEWAPDEIDEAMPDSEVA